MLTIKPGTKIRTKKIQLLRGWSDRWRDKEGFVVGAGKLGMHGNMIKINISGEPFDVYPQEIELVKPLKLKKFSMWK